MILSVFRDADDRITEVLLLLKLTSVLFRIEAFDEIVLQLSLAFPEVLDNVRSIFVLQFYLSAALLLESRHLTTRFAQLVAEHRHASV